MRRPLLTAAAAMLCLVLCLYALGIKPRVKGLDVIEKEIDGKTVTLTGTVSLVTRKEESCCIRIRQITILQSAGTAGENGITNACADKLNGLLKKSYSMLVYTDRIDPGMGYGDRVLLSGKAGIFLPPGNPGEFDLRSYYHHRKILCRISAEDTAVMIQKSGRGHLMRRLNALRAGMTDTFSRIFPPEDAAVLSALTVGDKALLPDSLRKLYTDAGIIHILAISGLHIQMIGMGLFSALRRRRFPFTACAAASLCTIILYTVVTGAGISGFRAVVMFAVFCLSQAAGTREDRPTSLGAALILVLAISPQSIAESSFWLSFGCMACLLWLAPAFLGLFPRRWQAHPAAGRAAAGLAVSVGILPLTCRFYYQFSPYTALVNLLILPTVKPLAMFGFLSGIAGFLSGDLAVFLGGPCRYILMFYRQLCLCACRLPGGTIIAGCPGPVRVLICYACIAGAVFFLKKRSVRRSSRCGHAGIISIFPFCLFLTAFIILLLPVRPRFQVVFLDVGQGECILVRSGPASFMVDCGSSSTEKVWARKVDSALRYYGISRLDGVFLTHGDSDHTGGISEWLALREEGPFRPAATGIGVDKIFVCGPALEKDSALRALVDKAGKGGIPAASLEPGDCVRDARITFEMLYPAGKDLAEDVNLNSMVLLLTYEDTAVLLTGDLEKEGEQNFVAQYRDRLQSLPHLVLKAGHHGSGNATGEELLQAASPSAVVISCGLHNVYGHPDSKMLERLRKRGIPFWRTDLDGAVVMGVRSKKNLVFSAPWK